MAEHLQPATARRRYHSPTRQRQAEGTRGRILDAARALFRDPGYAGTTLDAIAALATVSPKTVEATFGSKRGLLAALVDPVASGTRYQALLDHLRDTPDPRRRVEAVAQLTRQVYEASVPEFDLLRGASVVTHEVAEVARQIGARRWQNQTRLIAYLDDRRALRAGLAAEEAADVLWALTGYDLYRALVGERGWAPARYEAWLADVLIQRLLTSG